MWLFVAAAIAAAFAVLATVSARRQDDARARMIGTERSTVETVRTLAGAAGEAAGSGSYREVVELSGQVEVGPGGPLSSPETGTDCVWFRHLVQRRYRKRSNDGKATTSNATETVTSETSDAPFLLRDETGEILVRPGGAVDGVRKALGEFRKTEASGRRREDTIGYEHEEWVLEAGTRLYAVGEVADEEGTLVLRNPPGGTLLLSTRTEEELLADAAGSARNLRVLAGVIGVVAAALAVAGVVGLF